MGIEPRHDSRYVAEAIGYSCQLPSKTVHNRLANAKNHDKSARTATNVMRQSQQGAHVRTLGSACDPSAILSLSASANSR